MCDPSSCYLTAAVFCCHRRIWRKIDTLKSVGDLTVADEIDEDDDDDESAKWNWYIS